MKAVSKLMQDTLDKEEERRRILAELCDTHGLDPKQITFADDNTPIFDYEAVSLLSLTLTDISSIECVTERIDMSNEVVTARCTVTLPDGRVRTTSASAQLGEILGSGEIANSIILAEAVANSRAARRGIRAVGINLYRAHRRYVDEGVLTTGHTKLDESVPVLREIHVLATRAGLIQGSNRERYERVLASAFDGRTSSRDLSESERNRFVEMLRALTVSQN